MSGPPDFSLYRSDNAVTGDPRFQRRILEVRRPIPCVMNIHEVVLECGHEPLLLGGQGAPPVGGLYFCPTCYENEEGQMNDLLLDRLAREVASVTAEQIQAAAASLGPIREGEEKLLSVRDREDIHRLWALAHEYDKRGAMATFEAKYVAASQEEKNAAIPKIAQLARMEELLRDMVWYTIKEIDPALGEQDCLGLRAGFLVVKCQDPKAQAQKKVEQLLGAFGKLIGGKLVGFQVAEAGEEEGDDEEDDKGEKIQ